MKKLTWKSIDDFLKKIKIGDIVVLGGLPDDSIEDIGILLSTEIKKVLTLQKEVDYVIFTKFFNLKEKEIIRLVVLKEDLEDGSLIVFSSGK